MEKEQRPIYRYEMIKEGVYTIDLNGLVQDTSAYSAEQITNALKNKDVDTLREVSRYFYVVSGEYRRMVDYLGNIHTHRNIITPKIAPTFTDLNKFTEYHEKIMDYSAKARIDSTCSTINEMVVRDGVFYGYEREMPDGSVILQELPTAYCRSRYLINGNYSVEFNVKYFDTYRNANEKLQVFNSMPSEFLDLYNEYKRDSSGYEANWKMLDERFARCHKLDNGEIPLLSAVFPELLELQEYKSLMKLENKLDLYTLVIQKLPFDKDKGVLVHELEAKALHQNAKSMISGDGVDIFTTPCEIDTVKLRNSSDSGRSKIDDAISIVYNTSGTAQVLFNSAKGTGSTGLERGLKVDESLLNPLLAQHENWYNTRFESIISSKDVKFFITFLGVTIFNEKDKVATFKELATLGYSRLAPVVAAGIKQHTFVNLLDYENSFLKLTEKMIPVQSSYTSTGDKELEVEEDKQVSATTEIQQDREVDKDRGKVKNG